VSGKGSSSNLKRLQAGENRRGARHFVAVMNAFAKEHLSGAVLLFTLLFFRDFFSGERVLAGICQTA
jgi:hypothetical protein